ncbi:hypothetical protein GPLA_2778 [Paraglaciecola polaris LMG 21857]|uniref:Uncharacterized protein n=1 Tax=Paraglaciecola polaris LMG 21857 TaxID=1129793 RepID=K6ZTR4_9ALTE|nr:hypothetical protein GPLA_2778 [Paraglaciecola polaris LMG 21857]
MGNAPVIFSVCFSLCVFPKKLLAQLFSWASFYLKINSKIIGKQSLLTAYAR